MKIALLSDTHGLLTTAALDNLRGVDEIWHAGDFGTSEIADQLEQIAPVLGVYGNVDGQELRARYPLHQHVRREGVRIWMTHIGGVPGRYCIPIRSRLEQEPPDLFICGHTHCLRVSKVDDLGGMVHVNPGAAGRQGFQKFRSMLRFELLDGAVRGMDVIHL
jgi:putative phosphoesterase